MADRWDDLVHRLRTMDSVVVALSGGVDSSLVAVAAQEALGNRALAVTLAGPAVASEEVEDAAALARRFGLAHRVVPLDPLADERYASNPANRCYYCRRLEGGELVTLARELGFRHVVDGLHRDDLGDDRPGRRAMDELGVQHPLVEAGYDKASIRAEAAKRGLPNADTPANSCLASRVAHGERITPELLQRIDAAERHLRRHGFRTVRVRVSQNHARVEVGVDELPRLEDEPLRVAVLSEIRSLGFASAEIDPRGYRPGGGRFPLPLLPSPPPGR